MFCDFDTCGRSYHRHTTTLPAHLSPLTYPGGIVHPKTLDRVSMLVDGVRDCEREADRLVLIAPPGISWRCKVIHDALSDALETAFGDADG